MSERDPYLEGLEPTHEEIEQLKFREENGESLRRVLGFQALEFYVPVDPMDDLQCDSCQ